MSSEQNVETVIYTDGACKGNPGPGGWAWAVPGGAWGSGFEEHTTNQRMEITAAYRAVAGNEGRLRIVSDSTYVVNCFRDGWWRGWRSRGWKNSRREPVANRDLWEPFIDLVETRDVAFEWVKGHSGDEMNDLVDRLAVKAIEDRSGSHGEVPPTVDQLGPPDTVPVPSPVDSVTDERADSTAARDRRIPDGTLLSVVGVRSDTLAQSPSGERLEDGMRRILQAKLQMNADLVVLSGLRPGAEQIGARAARDAGVPFVAVLPYPDPVPSGSENAAEFAQLCGDAMTVVILESKRPKDGTARSAALSRRDGWLRSVSESALVVTDRSSTSAVDRIAAAAAEDQLARFSKALGDEVWELVIDEFSAHGS